MPSQDPRLEEMCRALWGQRVAETEDANRALRSKVDRLHQQIAKLEDEARIGREIVKMLKGIRENPSASALWDEILILLKFDKHGDPQYDA